MPQSVDPLSGRLGDAYRQSLREFFAHYDVEIVSCMYWRNRAPWIVEERKCLDTFFLFPVRGDVRVTLPKRTRVIVPGEYLALADEIPNALALEKGYAKLEQIALHGHIKDRWGRPFLARFRSPFAKLREPARWHRVLADLAALMSDDPPLARHRGRVLVCELIAELLLEEKQLAPLDRESDPRIERVLQRMKDELASPELSIEDLARGIEITATQMRKLFFRETRASPKQYLHRLRLERAVHLLRHSTQTIKQVALECGFTTDNYFHLVFQKAFGVTPAAFRKKEIL